MNMIDTKRIFDAVYKTGNPDTSKTLIAWQNRAISTRAALLEVQSQIDAQEQELNQIYQPAAVAELMRETRDAMAELVRGERDKLADDLDNILDAKRQQYKAIGLAAPTTEQINLLTALNLRDSVSEAEVSYIATEMSGNFQALRALKSIAKRSGIDLPDPPSVENVEEDLNLAREYATSSLRDIAVPNNELGYFSRCFYIAPGVGPARKFLDLDSNIFTSVQATPESEEENGHSER